MKCTEITKKPVLSVSVRYHERIKNECLDIKVSVFVQNMIQLSGNFSGNDNMLLTSIMIAWHLMTYLAAQLFHCCCPCHRPNACIVILANTVAVNSTSLV